MRVHKAEEKKKNPTNDLYSVLLFMCIRLGEIETSSMI